MSYRQSKYDVKCSQHKDVARGTRVTGFTKTLRFIKHLLHIQNKLCNNNLMRSLRVKLDGSNSLDFAVCLKAASYNTLFHYCALSNSL